MLLKRGVTGEEYSAELSFVCCSSGTQYLEYLNPWNFDSAVYGTTEELLEMRLTLFVSDSTE
ncbi:unnamed protein product, partial [Brassica rapa subsp. narinosa]